MINHLMKLKSDKEYISPSENYLVTFGSTLLRVIDIKKQETYKLSCNYPSEVCIDSQDKFLFYGKRLSSTIYTYDLESHKVIQKKTLKKNFEIQSITQLDDENLLVCLMEKESSFRFNGLYTFFYTLYKYNFKSNSCEEYFLGDICEMETHPLIMNNELYYKITLLDKETKTSEEKIILVKQDYVEENPQINEILLSNDVFHISSDDQYLAKIKNKSISFRNERLNNNKSKIIIYDLMTQKEVLYINDRKFETMIDCMYKLYRGNFIIDNEGNNAFYSVNDSIIDIYLLEKKEKVTIEFDRRILNGIVSIKNDFVFINSPDIYGTCFTYRLSDLLSNEDKHLIF